MFNNRPFNLFIHFIIMVFISMIFLSFGVNAQGGSNLHQSNHHSISSSGEGNFDYFQATFKVPSSDPDMPGVSDGACINYPVWIMYPDGGWLEMGISKCTTDPANHYHLYGYSSAVSGGWCSTCTQSLSLNQEVVITIQKKPNHNNTWQVYVDGQLKWEPSSSYFNNPTSHIWLGMEVQSPTYTARTGQIKSIYVRKTSWTMPALWPWWNYDGNSEIPYRYYSGRIGGSSYNQQSWGYGLPSRTNWGGANSLGVGQKLRGSTTAQQIREAEHYTGFSGIDSIAWQTAADGEQAIFAKGWHQGDRAEYLMDIPSNPFQLGIIAISDKPGPVQLNIYLDNSYIGQMQWAENDNNRHVWFKTFNVSGLKVNDAHAISIEFANDYYSGPGDGDRNYYVDLLAVIP